jgi:deoxyribodipyrimidine photo-lyase
LETPSQIPSHFKDLEIGEMPSIKKLLGDSGAKTIDNRAAYSFPGGETQGLARLREYIWDSHAIATYKKTRNELLGENFSSKFSAYLAQGCLSPKMIYKEVEKFETKVKKNNSTYWMKFELMWRDFYRLMAKKYTDKIFQLGGPKSDPPENVEENWDRFEAWAQGKTGIPFIDANMREINETGYMSNRGRQNVASYLIKDLEVDWRMGAEYFESLLIDYDPASNYGNWNYLAGVGADPMENRYFNILSQARRYDANGDYVRHWMPELEDFKGGDIHTVYDLPEDEWTKHQLHLNYNRPVIMPDW